MSFSLTFSPPNPGLSVRLSALSYELSMRVFHVALVDHGVAQGGFYAAVAQKHLDLFDGHTFVDGTCCHCASELMGMDALAQRKPPEFAQARFDGVDLQTPWIAMKGHEQCRLLVVSGHYISLQMDLGSCIKVNLAFFGPFSVRHAFTPLEVDVGLVELNELTNAHSCR